jgi:hypothetical protein
MTIKNIPNGQNIYQMVLKRPKGHKIYRHFPLLDPPKLHNPNLDFWFENIPSGNPAPNSEKFKKIVFPVR